MQSSSNSTDIRVLPLVVTSVACTNVAALGVGLLAPQNGWSTQLVPIALFCSGISSLFITFHVLARIDGQAGLYSLVVTLSDNTRLIWESRIRSAVTFSVYPLIFFIALLYLASNAPGDRVVVGLGPFLAASCGSILLSAPIYVRLWRADRMPIVNTTGSSQLMVAEKAFIIVGVMVGVYSAKVAAFALQETARANLSQTRGQLYQIEMQILEREANDERLSSIYSNRPRTPWATTGEARAQNYWHTRLMDTFGYVARDMRLKDKTSRADEEIRALVGRLSTVKDLENWLYRRSYSELQIETETERECRALAGKMASHFSAVMDHMHNAFDYKDQKMLTKEERDTWMGYFTDIGAHPVLVVCIFNWVNQGYLSADFYEHAVKARLKKVPNSDDALVLEHFLERSPGWQKKVEDLGNYGPDS